VAFRGELDLIRLLKKQPLAGVLFVALWLIFVGHVSEGQAQTPPDKPIVITTNREAQGDVFRSNESISLTVTANRRGYLTVFQARSDHRLILLYPTPEMKTNRVFPGETVQLPAIAASNSSHTTLITAIIIEKPEDLVPATSIDRTSGQALISNSDKLLERLAHLDQNEPERMSTGMLPVHILPESGVAGFATHRIGDWIFKAWVSDTSVKDTGPRPVYFWSNHPGEVRSVELIGDKHQKRASPVTRAKPEKLQPRRGNLVSLYSHDFDQALANEERGRLVFEAVNNSGAICTVSLDLGLPAVTRPLIAAPATPAPVFTSPPATKPANPSLVGAILHRQSVRPSSADQVVAWNNRVSITIPGGMLKTPETVTIAEVPPAAIPRDPDVPFASLGRYNIRIGDLTQLPQTIDIAMRYDPKKLKSTYAPGDQLMAARWDEERRRWRYLPLRIDERTNTAILTTDHLTVFEMLVVLILIPAVMDAGHVIYEEIVYDIFHTPNFGILYERHMITKHNMVHDDAWKKSGGGVDAGLLYLEKRGGRVRHGYHPGVPLYVQDVGGALEAALETYVDRERFNFTHGRGPTGSMGFLPVKIDSCLIQSRSAKGCFESLYDRVHLNTTYAYTPKALLAVTAHELFHSIQHFHFNYLKMTQFPRYLWWLEACAEYASARVAWQFDTMGSKADASAVPYVNPGLLRHHLEATGQPDSKFDELEYDKSYFIEYLVKRGFSFREMHLAVANFSGLTAPIFDPLNQFFLENGEILAKLYNDFAVFYLLSADSPVGGDKPAPGSIDQTYRFEGAALGKASQVTHTFTFQGPFAARLIAVTAKARPDNSPRRLLIKPEARTGKIVYSAFLLPHDQKPAGQPKPTLLLPPREDPYWVEVAPTDTLYILATQFAAEGGAGNIIISEAEFSLVIKPADIKDASGKLSWVFEGTATGIPPHVKKLATQWQFGPHYPSTIKPYQKPITDPLTIDILHQFPGTGTYEISLELFDDTHGRSESLARAEAKAELDVSTSLLFDPPILVTEVGGAVPIEVRVQYPPTSPQYNWEFGDGTPGVTTTVPATTHAFARPGEYRLQVTLTDAAAPAKPPVKATGRASVHPSQTLSNEPPPPPSGGIKTFRHMQAKHENGTELWMEYDYYTETIDYTKTACIIHGPFRYFTLDEKTEIKTRYQDGYLHGDYHEKMEGKTACTGQFAQGERTGKWTYYHSNGKVAKVFHFRKGLLNGVMEEFEESGLKIQEAIFENDLYVKTDRRWSEYQGKTRLLDVREFREDGYTTIHYHPDGRESHRSSSKGRLRGSAARFTLEELASTMGIGLTPPPECSLPKVYFNKIEEKRKKDPFSGWY
jgi:hypothetical protein